jgi:hypothetical protein
MSVVGVISGDAGQSDDRIAMDPDEPTRLSDAVALAQVVEHGMSLVHGEPAVEQGRALAFGEAGLARVAVEQADVALLTVALADGEISRVTSPVVGAGGILATEAGEVVHGKESSRQRGWVVVQGIG